VLCAVVTVIHLVVVAFIIIAGLTKADAANMTPFLLPDQGARGIFDGAALVRAAERPVMDTCLDLATYVWSMYQRCAFRYVLTFLFFIPGSGAHGGL
jgi:amino acid transporter